jgi:hypothetical protein
MEYGVRYYRKCEVCILSLSLSEPVSEQCSICHVAYCRPHGQHTAAALGCKRLSSPLSDKLLNVCLASGNHLRDRSLGSPLAFCFLDADGSAP